MPIPWTKDPSGLGTHQESLSCIAMVYRCLQQLPKRFRKRYIWHDYHCFRLRFYVSMFPGCCSQVCEGKLTVSLLKSQCVFGLFLTMLALSKSPRGLFQATKLVRLDDPVLAPTQFHQLGKALVSLLIEGVWHPALDPLHPVQLFSTLIFRTCLSRGKLLVPPWLPTEWGMWIPSAQRCSVKS